MSDQFWLTKAQFKCLERFFPWAPPIFGRVLDALQTYVRCQQRHDVPNADHFLT
jgi:hypothetical protein